MGGKDCATECGSPGSRNSHTSTLYKVLLTLKILHGSCEGAKGSKVDDIAMFMFKYFCLDGDIKSQVLASLRYGVNKNFLTKKGDRYSLLTPAASIYLTSCKNKKAEMKRVQCAFPATWTSTSFDNRNDKNQQKRTCQEANCGGDSSLCCPHKKQKQSNCSSCNNHNHNNNNNDHHQSKNSCSCNHRKSSHHQENRSHKGRSCRADPCKSQKNDGLCCPNLDKPQKSSCGARDESSEPSDSGGCYDGEQETTTCMSEESESSCSDSPPMLSSTKKGPCRPPPKRFEYCNKPECSSISRSSSNCS